MRMCKECGSKYNSDFCCVCNEEDETDLSYEEDIREYISESEKYLTVTKADKIFGFGSLAGIVAAIVLIVLFSNTVNDPELEIIFLVLSAILFVVGTVSSLLPKWIWFFKLYITSMAARFGSERPLYGLEARKVVSRAAFSFALLALIVFMALYPTARKRPSVEEIRQQQYEETIQELIHK